MTVLASLPTPAGTLNVYTNPDPSRPGLWIELPGEGDRQLVLVEYDADQASPEFVIQVWDAAHPSDAPAYVQHVRA